MEVLLLQKGRWNRTKVFPSRRAIAINGGGSGENVKAGLANGKKTEG